MIKGPRHHIRIDALDDEGAGVGGCEGLRVHVPYALPGELVTARIEHESPHRAEAWARLEEVAEASPDRVPAACAAWGACGGCAVQHLRYERQLEWKRRLTERSLKAAGIEVAVEPCVASPRTLGYRENSKLVFATVDGHVVLGAYRPRSHRVVSLAACRVVEDPLDDVAQALAGQAERLGIPIHDEASGEGVLRYALLRVSARGEVLILIVVGRRDASTAELARALRRERSEVVGVVENLQPSRGNVLIGDVAPDVTLDGASSLWEELGGLRLRYSPRAFSQSNRDIAARLYSDVAIAAALSPSERAIDAYCGAGGIALAMAGSGADVLGLEANPSAVSDALASAAASNRTNVRFVSGDAAKLLALPGVVGDRADVIVLDPPRRGCSPALLEQLPRLSPRRLLYVSCAPDTLARDLALLAGHRFHAVRATPYDMLPHTPHVEVLVELEPRSTPMKS